MLRILFIICSLISCHFVHAQLHIERHRLKVHSPHKGISRVRNYIISSAQIPAAFDSLRIVFLADTHYPSRFDSTALNSLRTLLTELHPDVLLLGGDYQEGCQYVSPLVDALTAYRPPLGTYAVLGNNDFERCTDMITQSFASHDIHLIENDTASIYRGCQRIIFAGAHNTFSNRETTPSPTLSLSDDDFVILLTHTPDYVEDQDIAHTDLALAGHTHGGQVTLFNLWAPVTNSHYGQRFRRGLKYNSANQPILITTGIGTSRKNIRIFAPSEVIVLTLHHATK